MRCASAFRVFKTEEASNASLGVGELGSSFGGDISRSAIYEVVAEQFDSPNVNKRSQFLRWLSDIFRRRRIRYKPTLNDTQKLARVAYAQHAVQTNFSDELRTIFVDEKRFEANSTGVYKLPVKDLTPTRRIQSKSNPLFVMILVAIAAPRR
jgi:hypothetical protein